MTENTYRTFELSDKVTVQQVTFKNRYGIANYSCYFDYFPANDLFRPAIPEFGVIDSDEWEIV